MFLKSLVAITALIVSLACASCKKQEQCAAGIRRKSVKSFRIV